MLTDVICQKHKGKRNVDGQREKKKQSAFIIYEGQKET